ICYYSAGSAENWRSDYGSFSSSDKGEGLQGWAGENWLNIRSNNVLNVMKKRIDLASQKGCDAIDPDNMDAYDNGGGGFSLTQDDSVKYLKSMASYAAAKGMSTGLKNAQAILGDVLSNVQFAINEECAVTEDTKCSEYDSLLSAGKALFHIVSYSADISTTSTNNM
ncbi:family 114 glycoside hydrolase, partial [Microthyrium microscopicum]